MPSPNAQDIYRHILQTAQRIAHTTQTSSGSPISPPASSVPNSFLVLPQPTPIVSTLLDDGVHPKAAQQLSELFVRILTNFQERLVANFRSTCSKISHTPRYPSMSSAEDLQDQLVLTFRTLYERRASAWLSEIRQMASSRSKLMGKDTSDKQGRGSNQFVQKTFNYNYLPMLEAFFVEEKFPSRADKMLLAKKAGMSYRQIHVWFQNRRSRTRKMHGNTDHRDLNRCGSSEDTDVEDASAKDYISSRASSFTLVADERPFESKPPSHAFPGKYPPDFDEKTDPFPCRFGDFSSFPKANWDRKCSVLPLRQDDAAVDVDALCESFGQLCIRSMPNTERVEADYPRIWGSYNPRPLSGCDVTAVYTTRPFSAPIPSFIHYPNQERDLRPCTIFRPQHRDLLQTEPNVSSLHSDDNPSNYKSASKTKRANKPRLPKRVPKNQPKLSAMSKSMPDPLGLANEADSRTRGRTLTPPLERVALVTRSASSSSDESLPSLTHSVSSSSSSEAQSPSSPAQGLPAESALCFMPEVSAISMPDASQGLLADIPFSLFASSDFNYDLLSSKPFVDNGYDLAFSQSQVDPFLSLQLQPPPAIPQSLPFSFDFAPLTS